MVLKVTIDLNGTAVISLKYGLFYGSYREIDRQREEALHYNLAELALMTGYSTRSLRTFYRKGLLTGVMEAGKYSFSEEDVEHFMAQPIIMSGMKTKTRMQVQHFLEEINKIMMEKP